MHPLLNRNQSYAEVYGSDRGARYVQNGVLFDVHGCPLLEPTFDPSKPRKPKPIRVEVPARTDDAIEAQRRLQ